MSAFVDRTRMRLTGDPIPLLKERAVAHVTVSSHAKEAPAVYVNNSEEAKRIRLDFAPGEHCHCSRDGEVCSLKGCPQTRNSGVDYQSFCCPLDIDYGE